MFFYVLVNQNVGDLFTGKRACVGEPLARMSAFLLFSAVMQHFKLEIVPGTLKPSVVPLDGFTVAPQPFNAKITLRI